MEQEHINTGEYAFDPQADNLKDAMQKVENNFTQLFDVAQNLNDQVSPPVILKITHTLPCRPDKGGLYLIDRKEKNGYKAYIERYNLNFGRVNRKNRPVGDADILIYTAPGNEPSYYGCALWTSGQTQILSGIINIDPTKPVNVLINGEGLNGNNHSMFLTYVEDEGQLYVENVQIEKYRCCYHKEYYTYDLSTFNPPVSSFRLSLYLYFADIKITSIIIRQEFDIPEEKITGDKRYVLTKWTGTEWIFPSVPDGAEIPIKGKTSYFKSGQIVTPAVDFPRLVKAKIGILDNPVTQQEKEYIYLIFDRPLEVAEFSMILSRYRGMLIRKNQSSMGFQKGKTWRRYTSRTFGISYQDSTAEYSTLRGFSVIGNNDFQKRFFGVTPITDYRVIRIPLAEFEGAFFIPGSYHGISYLKPLHSGLDKYIRTRGMILGGGNYHFDFGFELVKTVNGKRVFGPFNKLRMRISTIQITSVNLMK